jgi:branched-chain amino acid transport system substrate-binding protein
VFPKRIAVLAAAGLLAGCSVSVPRNGAQTAGMGLAQDGYAGELAPDGTVVGAGGAGVPGAAGSGGGPGAAAGGKVTTGKAGAGAGPGSSGAQPGTSGSGTPSGPGAPGTPGSPGGAARASAPGVTANNVTVSIIAGFSGPFGQVVEKAYAGLQTWQEDVNDAGGINGRKVVLKKVDHKETADGGIAACKQALSNGSYVAMIPEGIEANVTATSCLDSAGMPTLYFAGANDPRWKRAFSDVITTADAGTVMASYINKQIGPGKKIGVIYVNQLAYKALSDTMVPESRRLGHQVVGIEPVEPNQASFTSQLLRLKNAGTEVLVISATAEAIGILRDARGMGWRPTIAGWGFTFDFVTAAGRNLFDDVRGLRTSATVDTPAYERYAARMKARGRGHDRTVDTEGVLAYGHGQLLGEMLKRAGAQPTRASFVAGAETIRGYDNGILPPINYGRGDHVGTESAFPALCCNSDYTWKSQGPARTRF